MDSLFGTNNPWNYLTAPQKVTGATLISGAAAWSLYNYALSSSNDTPVVNFGKVAASVLLLAIAHIAADRLFNKNDENKISPSSSPSGPSPRKMVKQLGLEVKVPARRVGETTGDDPEGTGGGVGKKVSEKKDGFGGLSGNSSDKSEDPNSSSSRSSSTSKTPPKTPPGSPRLSPEEKEKILEPEEAKMLKSFFEIFEENKDESDEEDSSKEEAKNLKLFFDSIEGSPPKTPPKSPRLSFVQTRKKKFFFSDEEDSTKEEAPKLKVFFDSSEDSPPKTPPKSPRLSFVQTRKKKFFFSDEEDSTKEEATKLKVFFDSSEGSPPKTPPKSPRLSPEEELLFEGLDENEDESDGEDSSKDGVTVLKALPSASTLLSSEDPNSSPSRTPPKTSPRGSPRGASSSGSTSAKVNGESPNLPIRLNPENLKNLTPDQIKFIRSQWLENPNSFSSDLEGLKTMNSAQAIAFFEGLDSPLSQPVILTILKTKEGLEFIDLLMDLTFQMSDEFQALNICLNSLLAAADATLKDQLAYLVTRPRKGGKSYFDKSGFYFYGAYADFYDFVSGWIAEQATKTAKPVTTTTTTTTITTPSLAPTLTSATTPSLLSSPEKAVSSSSSSTDELEKCIENDLLKNPVFFKNHLPQLLQCDVKQARAFFNYSGKDFVLTQPGILPILSTDEGLIFLGHLIDTIIMPSGYLYNALYSCLKKLWENNDDALKDKLVELMYKPRGNYKQQYIEMWLKEINRFWPLFDNINELRSFYSDVKNWNLKQEKAKASATTAKVGSNSSSPSEGPGKVTDIKKNELENPAYFTASLPLLLQCNVNEARDWFELRWYNSILINDNILRILKTDPGLELIDHLMDIMYTEETPLKALYECLIELWGMNVDAWQKNDYALKDKLVELMYKPRGSKTQHYIEKSERTLKENTRYTRFCNSVSSRKLEQEKTKAHATTAKVGSSSSSPSEEPEKAMGIIKKNLKNPDYFRASLPLLLQCNVNHARDYFELSDSEESILFNKNILLFLKTDPGLELIDHLMDILHTEWTPLKALHSCLRVLWQDSDDILKGSDDTLKDKLVELVYKPRGSKKQNYLEKWEGTLKQDMRFTGFCSGVSRRKLEQEKAKAATTTATIKDEVDTETMVASQLTPPPEKTDSKIEDEKVPPQLTLTANSTTPAPAANQPSSDSLADSVNWVLINPLQ